MLQSLSCIWKGPWTGRSGAKVSGAIQGVFWAQVPQHLSSFCVGPCACAEHHSLPVGFTSSRAFLQRSYGSTLVRAIPSPLSLEPSFCNLGLSMPTWVTSHQNYDAGGGKGSGWERGVAFWKTGLHLWCHSSSGIRGGWGRGEETCFHIVHG